jgi:hypothetical protein
MAAHAINHCLPSILLHEKRMSIITAQHIGHALESSNFFDNRSLN